MIGKTHVLKRCCYIMVDPEKHRSQHGFRIISFPFTRKPILIEK
jgi:hypothetical protein